MSETCSFPHSGPLVPANHQVSALTINGVLNMYCCSGCLMSCILAAPFEEVTVRDWPFK